MLARLWNRYGKAAVAIAAAGLTVAYGALSGDRHIDPDEGVQIAIATTTAVMVYLVPLMPRYRWVKTATAAVLAALQVLTTVILGGLDQSEWIALVLAALTVLGVGAAPATSTNGVSSAGPSGREPSRLYVNR